MVRLTGRDVTKKQNAKIGAPLLCWRIMATVESLIRLWHLNGVWTTVWDQRSNSRKMASRKLTKTEDSKLHLESLTNEDGCIVWSGQPKPVLFGKADVVVLVFATVIAVCASSITKLSLDPYDIFYFVLCMMIWFGVAIMRPWLRFSRLKNTRYFITDRYAIISVNSLLEKSVKRRSLSRVELSILNESNSLSTVLLEQVHPVVLFSYRTGYPIWFFAFEMLEDHEVVFRQIQHAKSQNRIDGGA